MAALVYIVENDDLLRTSYNVLLAAEGYNVEEFSDSESFLEHVADSLSSELSPRCLLVAVLLPGMGGLELLEELHHRQIKVPTVLLSGQAEIATAVEALKNGAVDFLEKPVKASTLLTSVARALELDKCHTDNRSHRIDFQIRSRSLSSREREVLDLTVSGRNSKEISATLGIGVSTVLKHKAQMLAKMGVKNDVELTLLVASIEPPSDPVVVEPPESEHHS